ncbi:MAG TPA: NUDIX hydrolase [Phenylobacterium sp.]|nr:NUDIX hydrolase [Phenylobacterium sp.]
MSDAPTLPRKPEGPPRIPGKPAVRPRYAATLLLVRRDGPSPRVLMGRRHGGHDFMPDKWVFPGGRIDRADYVAPRAAELDPALIARLAPMPAKKAEALALTAIRETFEEAGLLLAKPAAKTRRAGPWRPFLAQGALPDPSGMRLVARAVTPPMVGKRFDTLFFLAEADGLISLERQADCGELDEIAWFDFEAAKDLDLPAITRTVIKEAGLQLEDPDRRAPFIRFAMGGGKTTYL